MKKLCPAIAFFILLTICSQSIGQTCTSAFYYQRAKQYYHYYEFYNTGSSGSGYTYSWDFGNGFKSSLESPTFIFAQQGNYKVCLVVRNTISSCSDTFCQTVKSDSLNPCDASFTAVRDTINYLKWHLNLKKLDMRLMRLSLT